MSDTSLASVYYKEEVTWGTTPAGPPKLTELRITGESLGKQTQNVRSASIRSTADDSDVVRTQTSASGDINTEVAFGANDPFLSSCLRSADFAAETSVTGVTISAAAADNSYNDSANGFTNFAVGQWIKVSGFVAANNNGWSLVTTKTNGKLIVTNVTLTVEAVGPSVTIKTSFITNGVTKRSFVLEKKLLTSAATRYHLLNGMRVGSTALQVQPGQIATQSFSFTGKSLLAGAATAGDGSPTAANSNSVMNAIDNVSILREGGTPTPAFSVTNFQLNINSNLRENQAIGSGTPIAVGIGTIEVSGSMEIYFDNDTWFSKYLDWTTSDLAVLLTTSGTGTYVYYLPSIKYTAGEVMISGKDGDLMAKLSFQGFRNSTYGYTVGISRVAG